MTSKFELTIDEDSQGNLDASILIDGIVFGEDCIDLDELKKSAISSGGYDLQTCGCGDPGCAGFYEPIFVQHEGEIVTWEFDARNHPIPEKDDDAEFAITRYKFNRKQYITEIQEKFNWLKNHPKKSTIGSYGFDSSIFNVDVFYHSKPKIPFENGAEIIVGYTEKFQQAFVWIENDVTELLPSRVLPNCDLWAKFSDWTSIWRNKGQKCIYPHETTVLVCNQKAEDLAKAIQKYWGDAAKVSWEEIISDSAPLTFVRHHFDV